MGAVSNSGHGFVQKSIEFFIGNKSKEDLIFVLKDEQKNKVDHGDSLRTKYQKIKDIADRVSETVGEGTIKNPSLYVQSSKGVVAYIDRLYASEPLPTRIFMRIIGFKSLKRQFNDIADAAGRLQLINEMADGASRPQPNEQKHYDQRENIAVKSTSTATNRDYPDTHVDIEPKNIFPDVESQEPVRARRQSPVLNAGSSSVRDEYPDKKDRSVDK